MPYSTVIDISNAITESSVLQLTDDEGIAAINESRVNAAISFADELINGYLRSRYVLPLPSTPPMVRDLSVSISVYKLYDRRFAENMPESIQKKYDGAVKLLESIQKGIISLGVEQTSEPSEGGFKTNKGSTDRIFSKTKLDTY